jgi:hypothetical protein
MTATHNLPRMALDGNTIAGMGRSPAAYRILKIEPRG